MRALVDHKVICVHCGGEDTHHFRVTAFARDEDADRGSLISMMTDGDGMFVREDPTFDIVHDVGMSGCPSKRRGGITILLVCEDCEQFTQLDIYQHKGGTYIDTRAVGVKQ